MNPRKGYELEGLFLDRPIRPFHFAVMLATSTIAVLLWIPSETIDGWEGPGSHVLAVAATNSALLLFVGWWFRNEWAAEWGLLLAVGVWVARAFYVLSTGGESGVIVPWASATLSIAWAIGAGGAYLLERYDHETRGADE